MSTSCPITFKLIDGNIARIGSFFVMAFVLIYLVSAMKIFLYILALDFFIRIYLSKEFSIIYQLSRAIKKILKIKTRMTDSGAKRLAAQFGLLFSLILIIEAHLELTLALNITSLVLLTCAFLEFILDYCIGCKIYYLIKRYHPTSVINLKL